MGRGARTGLLRDSILDDIGKQINLSSVLLTLLMQPGMGEDLLSREPLGRVDRQARRNEVSSGLGHALPVLLWLESEVASNDAARWKDTKGSAVGVRRGDKVEKNQGTHACISSD
jgi:hypothetical protein